MSDTYFLTAAGLSALWFGVHLVLGGRDIAKPLLAATDLTPVVRDTQYLCWHFTSVAIAAMAGFFLWAGITGENAFAVSGTLLAAGFFLTGTLLTALIGARFKDLPQGWLFLPVAGLGLAGLIW